MTSTVYYADTRIHYAGSRMEDSFIVGYVEAERHLATTLTGFVRWEDSYGANGSPYCTCSSNSPDRGAWPDCAGILWNTRH